MNNKEDNQFKLNIDKNAEYTKMIDVLKEEVETFTSNFADDPSLISGWGHNYFCSDDGGRLIYNPDNRKEHKCPVCGKLYTGEKYDSVWTYMYRNEAILATSKSAILYKYTEDKKYLDAIETILGFYADNYSKFKLHTKEAKVYETIEEMTWGCGKLMPQGLNESLIVIRAVNSLEIVKDSLSKEFLEKMNNWFVEIFNLLKPQVDKVHNIIAWNNSCIGVMGLFSKNQEMIDFAFEGEFNIHRQVKEGVTKDSFWYEGSIHYNFFTLEGFSSLLLFARLYNYDMKESGKILENMYIQGYNYAFDSHQLPNPNDGWPNINLKTYLHIYAMAARVYGEDSTVGNLYKNIIAKDTERGQLPLSKPYFYDNKIELERLSLTSHMDFDNFDKIDGKSYNYEESQYGMVKNDKVNVFYKYGHRGPSHAHPDKMNIEVTINNKSLSRDLSNSGYGVPLCNEYHRMTISHNTIVVNGKNQVNMDAGETLEFSDNVLKAKVDNVYSINGIKVEEIANMNWDESVKYMVRYLGLSEAEATKISKERDSISEKLEKVIDNSLKINYVRKVELQEDGFTDEFEVESDTENTYDYFFHSEADLIEDGIDFVEGDLVFDDNGYQHVKNVRKVKTTGDKFVLNWKLGETKLASQIDITNCELFIAETYDNPVVEKRTSIIVRNVGQTNTFKLNWRIN